MRTAATLLQAARSLQGLSQLIRAIGLADASVDMSSWLRDAIEPDVALETELSAGPGSIRVLSLRLLPGLPLRDALQRVARRVTTRAPHVLWLITAVDSTGSNAALVACSAGAASPRLASLLWETSGVLDSDAETLCALAAVRAAEDVLVHTRCTEVLGRDALTRRFYRALETQVQALSGACPVALDESRARGVALLYASRLLFLRFLEAKGWLDGDRAFLTSQFDECMRGGGGFHRRVLLPLFFGTLNTPVSRRARAARALGAIPFLNGGLFARTPLERRAGYWRFPDEQLGALFEQLFQRFRFVVREDTATWSEASVDPEMLGRAFESLMATGERRASGVYFTPHALVARVADQALSTALADSTRRSLREFRVLDPACGSGAFLVHVLERLADLRHQHGDPLSTAAIRRDVLARSIFGVDRNPTAVWLCELRLWLSVVIESEEQDPLRVPPLPNLDRNIRVGDAIAGGAFTAGPMAVVGSARIEDIRSRYIRATGRRKQSLALTLDRAERQRALARTEREVEAVQHARRERLAAQRAKDLFGMRTAPSPETRRELKQLRDRLRALRVERRRIMDGGALPFSFHTFFSDAQAHGGFDIVLGNPPWVRLHRIPTALRQQFKQSYDVYRCASWASGASGAKASPGFAAQVDLSALFVERAVALLRPGGTLSLLLPSKLWRSLAGGGVRRLLSQRTQVVRLEDLSEVKHTFDAAVYPSLLVARAGEPATEQLTMAIHHGADLREWSARATDLAFDATPGAPWLMLTPDARRAFDRLRDAGSPLARSSFGPPRLGVKSGCNAAFVVRVTDASANLATIVDADGETGTVELSLLRPALRGDGVLAWHRQPCRESILWTHDEQGAPLARLPDRTRHWLRRRYGELAARTDAARSRRWWSLFRVDAAEHDAWRLVWADFGKRPRAAVLPLGDPTVPLNTCYVLRCADEDDAWALAAILNSLLAAAWLNAIAEPARGGYRRYLGWTVGLLPVPHDWPRARNILAAARGADDEHLLDATLSAYRLTRSSVSALLQWPQ